MPSASLWLTLLLLLYYQCQVGWLKASIRNIRKLPFAEKFSCLENSANEARISVWLGSRITQPVSLTSHFPHHWIQEEPCQAAHMCLWSLSSSENTIEELDLQQRSLQKHLFSQRIYNLILMKIVYTLLKVINLSFLISFSKINFHFIAYFLFVQFKIK